jgi:hypothetical protein
VIKPWVSRGLATWSAHDAAARVESRQDIRPMAKENQMLSQQYLADELNWQRLAGAERNRLGRRHQHAVRVAAREVRRARHRTPWPARRALQLRVEP